MEGYGLMGQSKSWPLQQDRLPRERKYVTLTVAFSAMQMQMKDLGELSFDGDYPISD